MAGISQTSGTYSPSAPALSFLPAMRTLRPVMSSRVPNGMPVPISTSPWRDITRAATANPPAPSLRQSSA